jgi:hypothetical protein
MSDDTPTERFDAAGKRPDGKRPDGAGGDAGGDAPTERLGQPVDDPTPTARFDMPVGGARAADTPTEQFDGARSAQIPGDNAPTERFVAVPRITTSRGDVPTARYPSSGQEPPTVRLPAPGAVPSGRRAATSARQSATNERTSHGLLYTLIAIGAALLIAVVVLLLQLYNDGQNPVVAPTQTESAAPAPSEEPSEEPEPSPEPTPSRTVEPVAAPTFDDFAAPTVAECEEGEDSAPLEFSWSSSDAVRAFIGVGTDDASIDPFASDLPPVFTFRDLEFDCAQDSEVYTVTLEGDDGQVTSQSVTIRR